MVSLMQRAGVETPEVTFMALYDREAPLVLRYLRGWTRPGEDVEDLVAETFARAWRAWPRFHGGDTEARAWLLRIARNQVIGRWRRAKGVRLVAVPDSLADAGSDPESSAGRLDLAAALSHLGRAERDLVALRAAGLSHAEIGNLSGRSEAAVKMAWHRAAARLRPHLELQS
jgi:RNA polymerase sigma-70 factor (ECF subfamily)